MDVESVADELYGLPLNEFTPTRGDREKQAKSAGDKDLAAQIHHLAKPNLVAWLANQLAREHAEEIRPLLELGAELREATQTMSGEQLRALSGQQRQLVGALVQQARRLAKAAGRGVSQDTARALEDTLRAALADSDAAEALTAGRLTEGMQNSGFGSLAGRDQQSTLSTKGSRVAAAPSPADRQRTLEPRRRAEHDLEQAKSAADEAHAERRVSQDVVEVADQTVADTAARVEQVRRELDEALVSKSLAEKDQARAQEAFHRAEQRAQDAQQRLVDATASLTGRTGSDPHT